MLRAIILLSFIIASTAVSRAQTQCETLKYFNEFGQDHVHTMSLPTVWWGVLMSPTRPFTATVDSAYVAFGIQKNNTTLLHDTLEVRILKDTLPVVQVLDNYVSGIIAGTGGQIPDAYWIVELDFTLPLANVPAGKNFWLSWRLRGPAADMARIIMKKPASAPSRSVVIKPNGSTETVTQYLASPTFTDSVDLGAETHVCYPGAPPVELSSFKAVWRSEKGILEWTTATETNNFGFEVERLADASADGAYKIWQRIGFVAGHGNSTREQRYTFVDEHPRIVMDADGIVRYRLRQIDFDGIAVHTHVAELRIPATAGGFSHAQSRPNPLYRSAGSARLGFSLVAPARIRIELLDLLGRPVRLLCEGDYRAGEHETVIEAAGLSPGGYFAVLSSGNLRLTRRLSIPD